MAELPPGATAVTQEQIDEAQGRAAEDAPSAVQMAAEQMNAALREMPESRERSMALTKLDECLLWARSAGA